MKRKALCLTAVAVLLSVAPAGAAELSASDYRARIARASEIATQSQAGPSRGAMNDVRAALGLPAEVRINGLLIRVPRDAFLDTLSGTTAEDFQRAALHLSALTLRLDQVMNASVPDPAAVRSALRASYVGITRRPGLASRLLEQAARLLGLFFAWFGHVLSGLGRFSGAGTVIAWTALIALIVVVLFAIRRLRFVQDRVMRRPKQERTDVDWHQLAEDALRRGDDKEAVRALYRSLLAVLNGRGIVRDAPSLTAGECRHAVSASRPALFPAVARATLIFEQVTYGLSSFGERELEAMREAERGARAA